MQAILDVVRAQRRSPADYEHALDDLAEEVQRLHTLAENLLRLARSAQPATRARESVDLALLLADVADALRPLAEEQGLTLTCQPSEPIIVCGESDELIRLFANLLHNAIKYTAQGCIAVAAQRLTASQATVTVTDTGIGIAVEHLPHVFDRFYRVDTARTRNGAGLGLSIAQEIVHAHGGSISLDSRLGQGTTVTVRLPLTADVSDCGVSWQQEV